jgi:hypothetical protein
MIPITIELTRDELHDDQTGLMIRPGNGQVFIEPLEESRRARWQKSQHMPPEARTDPRIAHAPEQLPGYRVTLDIKERSVRVFDPLYKNDEFEPVIAAFRDRLGRRLDIEKPIVREKLSSQQLWAWAKWMFRACETGNALPTLGKMPTIVERRVAEERAWDLAADPETGKRKWEPEPELV